MIDTLHALCPALTQAQLTQFDTYYALLIDWNSRMNLTAITEPDAVAQKHFADSLMAEPLLPKGARVIDVGTGAGFPGIPLLIVRPDLSMTLLDGLNKRVTFLLEACRALGLNAACVHMRAEDAGQSPLYRAKFDVALTRAVAALPVLLELTLPLVKVGGMSVAYKGDAADELVKSKSALHLLHASARVQSVTTAYGARSLVVVDKLAPTPKAYPRRAGTPEKNPL